jgi:hypothetical protein
MFQIELSILRTPIIYVMYTYQFFSNYGSLLRKLMKVRFQVLTAASKKMTVFWDVVPCSLVEVYRRCSGTYYLPHRRDGGSKHH